MNYLIEIFNKGWQFICNITTTGLGTTLIVTGTFIEQVSLLIIIAGILLWMCKYTKVFRSGMIGFLIGFLLEILGLMII